MVDFIIYLLKVSLCLCTFYVLYILVFRNTTFFHLNRLYLVGSIIASFVMAALQINLPYEHPTFILEVSSTITNPAIELASSHEYGDVTGVTSSANVLNILCLAYSVGVLVALTATLLALIQVLKIQKHSRLSRDSAFKIYRSDYPQPFSFFNSIFLPTNNGNALILEHEKIHVRQYHWIDLTIVALAHIILWFNPIMIFLKRSLKVQHEYLADEGVLNKTSDVEEYLLCLLQQINLNNNFSLLNNFYSKTIKQRITMMTKTRTSLRYSAMYLLLLPIGCTLLFAFSSSTQIEASLTNTVDENRIIIIDAGHGGDDEGAKQNGVSEKALTLTLARKILTAGQKRGMNIVLTRSTDEQKSLASRVELTKQSNGNLFISLHINFDELHENKSGIECVVSEKNPRYQESLALSERLLAGLNGLQGMSTMGLKKGDPVILKDNAIPSTILELGYLSNENDFNFLTDENNQQLIADKIIKALEN